MCRNLRLLDLSFQFEADHASALDHLGILYSAPEFRHAEQKPAVSVRLRIGDGTDWHRRVADWTFDRLIATSRNFLLVHAGALTYRDQGLLLVGPPFSGKTTLAVALAEQGLTYYSDDVAPVHREDGRLRPFRRAAAVRLSNGSRDFRSMLRGAYIDHADRVPPPCSLGWVFLLSMGSGKAEGGREPRLEQVSHEKAALCLLRHTLNRAPGTALYRDYGDHPHLKAYRDLLAALGSAQCYRLTPGTVGATVSVLLEAVRSTRP